jgi:hypothetical protein
LASNRQRKLGEGAARAAFRQGHKEIAQILPAFPDSMRIVEEPGQLNNPTPLEVYSERHDVESPLQAKQREMRPAMVEREPDKGREPEPGE